jgi:hypothetical protein
MASLVPTIPISGDFALGAGAVNITVVIGELQQGFTIVMLDAAELASGSQVRNQAIGLPAQLAGKTLWADTTVTITNPLTMRTSVQIVLDDGVQTRVYPAARQLAAVGDSVIYEGRIRFT